MGKQLFFSNIFMLVVGTAFAQGKDYRVVFDLTSRDTINQQAVIREIGLIKDANPDARLEVVIYGQGLDLAVKGRSAQEGAVQRLIAGNKANFKVCAMTLKRNNIDKDQLVPGVEVVPDGIYEILSRQREGWGYIKVAH
ncbi:MAG TPA: DsrE family protein [Puia sp.]|jgi:intracellular sulfur oxidation DsrE/DsrF family protein|nr:DsrE family protein [Puia sp.]